MFIDFWCEIYESVKRKPSRTILTGIGISWGIFILIVLVGIGSGFIIRKSKFPQNPKRSVRFSGKRTKRSVQKRKARNTQKAETKVL